MAVAAVATLVAAPVLVLEIAPDADASTDLEAAVAVIVEATPVDVTLPGPDDAPELLVIPDPEPVAAKAISAPASDEVERPQATDEATEAAAAATADGGEAEVDEAAPAAEPTPPPTTVPPPPPTTAPPTTVPPTTVPPTTVPPATTAPAPEASTSGPTAEQWAALRQCEASGSYTAVNPVGYYGAYQFSTATWDWVASIHAPHLVGVRPDRASPAEQDAMALALYGMRGASPWPHCGAHLS